MTLTRDITESDFVGVGEHVPFFGVVEAIDDPLTIGRAKVRIFGFHSESKEDIPTKDLPWANVLLPTTSAGIGGQGSVVGLKPGSWVAGYFADGRNGQYPIIIGVIPRIERPANVGDSGNAGGAYSGDDQDQYSTSKGKAPFYGDPAEKPNTSQNNLPNKSPAQASQMPNNVGFGGTTGDDGAYLTERDREKWPLKNYSFGEIANGNTRFRIHRATALALDALASDVGKATIRSSYRDPGRNQRVGGAKGSQHMAGKAFDVRNSTSPRRFIIAAIKRGFVGFGGYDQQGRSIHLDTGSGRYWGPSYRAGSAPKWLTEILNSAEARNAGWYPGKPGLTGIKTEPGTQDRNDRNQLDNESGATTPRGSNGNPTSRAEAQSRMYSYYTERGYSQNATYGIMGNAHIERPTWDYSGINADSRGTTAQGMFGFNSGGELPAYNNYLRQNNLTDSFDNQMGFVDNWMNRNPSVRNQLNNASSPSEAAGIFDRRFERSDGSAIGRRMTAAENFAGGNRSTGNVPPANPNQIAQNDTGFRDPANSTRPEYKGKPTTNLMARGFNGGGQWSNQLQNDGTNTQSGFPIPGNRGSFAAIPDSAAAPQYPFNHIVHASMTGHMIEMDDSPQAERVNILHRSGSRKEFLPGGTVSDVTNGNYYHMTAHNSYNGVVGDYYLGVKGDLNLRSTSDMAIHSDGGLMINSYNDRGESVAGKYDVNAGDVIRFKSAKLVIIEGKEGVHVYTTKSIYYHAEEDIHFKAGKNIYMEAGEGYNLSVKKDYQIKVEADFKFEAKNINMKSGEKVAIQSGGQLDIKSGSSANIQASSTMNVKASTLKIGGGDAVNVVAGETKVTPDWTSGGSEPGSASNAAESKPKKPDDATDADLGPPLKRKNIENHRNQKQNPDTSIRSAAANFYSSEA